MPTLNEETGFYRGRTFEHDYRKYAGECVAAAVANYLKLCAFSKDTIEHVATDILKSPDYKGVGSGFSPFDIPEVVERALQTHIDKNIHVTEYLTYPEDTIPDGKKGHVKHMDAPNGMMDIDPPAIILSEVDEKYGHVWVLADEKGKRIDNDGYVYKTLGPHIKGYLEVKLLLGD